MDQAKMTAFVEKAIDDVGALVGGALVVIGDKLGLYRAMAWAGRTTPAELAARTGTAARLAEQPGGPRLSVVRRRPAGSPRLRELVTGAGFTTFRRVAQTPFNNVLEARM